VPAEVDTASEIVDVVRSAEKDPDETWLQATTLLNVLVAREYGGLSLMRSRRERIERPSVLEEIGLQNQFT
jgi:hypothetical protein